MTTYAPIPVQIRCAQCGRLPRSDEELARWRYGRLAAAGELDETSVGILVCPDCRAEGERGAPELGVGD